MFTVYILYSLSFSKSYTGQTSNLEKRLQEHNLSAEKGFTLKYRPWILIHTETFETRAEAMKREKYLKTWEGRIFVKAIIDNFLASQQ